ncbi:MAG: Spy/CpxP family protein refolding chaperone [Proteobacteria bacterium]|nr:Spy/CpxP family protein refolding chaperone [Pseudomonadota bacterium]
MKTRFLPLLTASTLVIAACAPLRGPGGEPPGQGGMGRGGGAMVVAQIQGQLQQTAEALQLTPRQLPLWEVYQEKVGALMADQLKLSSYAAVSQSAPKQVAHKVEVVRNRLAAMEDIQDAAEKLYATLDDTQKKIADQRLAQTVPALYSGLGDVAGGSAEQSKDGKEQRGAGGRGRRGGGPGGMGAPDGMGGGFSRM